MEPLRVPFGRASQFSRYLFETAGISDKDINAFLASLNSLSTIHSPHFWPLLRRESCEALAQLPLFRLNDRKRVIIKSEIYPEAAMLTHKPPSENKHDPLLAGRIEFLFRLFDPKAGMQRSRRLVGELTEFGTPAEWSHALNELFRQHPRLRQQAARGEERMCSFTEQAVSISDLLMPRIPNAGNLAKQVEMSFRLLCETKLSPIGRTYWECESLARHDVAEHFGTDNSSHPQVQTQINQFFARAVLKHSLDIAQPERPNRSTRNGRQELDQKITPDQVKAWKDAQVATIEASVNHVLRELLSILLKDKCIALLPQFVDNLSLKSRGSVMPIAIPISRNDLRQARLRLEHSSLSGYMTSIDDGSIPKVLAYKSDACTDFMILRLIPGDPVLENPLFMPLYGEDPLFEVEHSALCDAYGLALDDYWPADISFPKAKAMGLLLTIVRLQNCLHQLQSLLEAVNDVSSTLSVGEIVERIQKVVNWRSRVDSSDRYARFFELLPTPTSFDQSLNEQLNHLAWSSPEEFRRKLYPWFPHHRHTDLIKPQPPTAIDVVEQRWARSLKGYAHFTGFAISLGVAHFCIPESYSDSNRVPNSLDLLGQECIYTTNQIDPATSPRGPAFSLKILKEGLSIDDLPEEFTFSPVHHKEPNLIWRQKELPTDLAPEFVLTSTVPLSLNHQGECALLNATGSSLTSLVVTFSSQKVADPSSYQIWQNSNGDLKIRFKEGRYLDEVFITCGYRSSTSAGDRRREPLSLEFRNRVLNDLDRGRIKKISDEMRSVGFIGIPDALDQLERGADKITIAHIERAFSKPSIYSLEGLHKRPSEVASVFAAASSSLDAEGNFWGKCASMNLGIFRLFWQIYFKDNPEVSVLPKHAFLRTPGSHHLVFQRLHSQLELASSAAPWRCVTVDATPQITEKTPAKDVEWLLGESNNESDQTHDTFEFFQHFERANLATLQFLLYRHFANKRGREGRPSNQTQGLEQERLNGLILPAADNWLQGQNTTIFTSAVNVAPKSPCHLNLASLASAIKTFTTWLSEQKPRHSALSDNSLPHLKILKVARAIQKLAQGELSVESVRDQLLDSMPGFRDFHGDASLRQLLAQFDIEISQRMEKIAARCYQDQKLQREIPFVGELNYGRYLKGILTEIVSVQELLD